MVKLKEPLATLWRGKDPFIEVKNLQGDVFRALETRRTLRFTINNGSYFLKYHHGTTLKEIIKNLISLRLPVLGADREWKAIHRLELLGINTMKGIGFGQKGKNPIQRISFIITEDLTPTISLEDYCANWKTNSPELRVKRIIIEQIAKMMRQMHQGGINHRDCYLCHFLLHLPFDGKKEQLKISIIDLHRAQIRSKVPQRWRNKDLIGLYFSSRNIGLTKYDIMFFLRIYFNKKLKNIFAGDRDFFNKIDVKAEKIRERTQRKSL